MDDFSNTLQSALAPGYTLERELTGGGMSRVFVANDVSLGRKVVVKVLPPELAAGVNHERFRREIQVAAQLQHPHVVPLLSAGEQGSLIWYTMPYIAGHSLREAVQRGDKFAIKDVVRILRDVAEALDHAHGLGVIHRDIKPGNVLLMGSHALVTDFGVSKAISASMPSSGYTSAGMAIGTPAYMAPEQIAADPAADHRMDLYALGLIAYEMLTGQVPFKESSPQQTMAAQLTRDPAPVETSRADVPPRLSALIKKLLAKAPDDRPQQASEVVAELDEIALSSGATLASHAPARRAGLGRTVGVAAAGILVVAAAWALGQRTGETVGTSFLRDSLLAAESTQAVAPASAMLTREDSMAIAQAVASRMAERPAPAARRMTSRRNDSLAAVALADSFRMAIQRTLLDSMLKIEASRVSLIEGQPRMSGNEPRIAASDARDSRDAREAGTDARVDVRMPDINAAISKALATAEAVGLAAAPRVSTGPRRVVIALPRPSRVRPEADAMASVLADSLRARLSSDPRYVLVPADSVAEVLRESRTVNTVQEKLQADLILSIALVPLKGDTLMRMIQMRDLRAPGMFSHRVVTGSGVLGGSPSDGVTEMMPKVVYQLNEMQSRPAEGRAPEVQRPPRTPRPSPTGRSP